MSVPRARKKKRPVDQYSEKFRRAKVAESIKFCLAEAILEGYMYYGYRSKRLMGIVNAYISEMDVVNTMNLTASDMARRGSELVDLDIIEECKSIANPYRRECYYLCIGTMMFTLKKLKWSKARRNQFVKSVITGIKQFDIYKFVELVAEETGFNVHTKIHW